MRYYLVGLVLLLTGCETTGAYMERRNWRGCYDARIAIDPPASHLVGDGVVLTGDITPEQCLQLLRALKGVQ